MTGIKRTRDKCMRQEVSEKAGGEFMKMQKGTACVGLDFVELIRNSGLVEWKNKTLV